MSWSALHLSFGQPLQYIFFAELLSDHFLTARSVSRRLLVIIVIDYWLRLPFGLMSFLSEQDVVRNCHCQFVLNERFNVAIATSGLQFKNNHGAPIIKKWTLLKTIT